MKSEPTFDGARQALAREYGRSRRVLALVEMLLGPLYLAAWAAFPWALSLKGTLTQIAERWRLPSGLSVGFVWLGIAVAVAAPAGVLSLPLDLYGGYRLPQRYGLSNQSLSGWMMDRLKGLAVGAVLGIPMLLVLYVLLEAAGRSWWLWASLAYAGTIVILTALGPILLIPIFYRLRPLGEPHLELRGRLTRLAETAGVRVRSVNTIDLSRRTKAANAMLVGLGRTRRIVLGDTLLDSFDPDEIETVMAHELGHQVHRDVPLGILVQGTALSAIFLAESLVLSAMVRDGRLLSVADPAGWPFFLLTWSLLTILEAPLLNLYSRWREGRADDFALRLSRKPEAFLRSMIRLGDQNLAEAYPPAWAVALFGTHPPLGRRVERARQEL